MDANVCPHQSRVSWDFAGVGCAFSNLRCLRQSRTQLRNTVPLRRAKAPNILRHIAVLSQIVALPYNRSTAASIIVALAADILAPITIDLGVVTDLRKPLAPARPVYHRYDSNQLLPRSCAHLSVLGPCPVSETSYQAQTPSPGRDKMGGLYERSHSRHASGINLRLVKALPPYPTQDEENSAAPGTVTKLGYSPTYVVITNYPRLLTSADLVLFRT